MKNRVGFIKLRLRAGSAKPAPPVSSMLGQKRLNVPEFCKQFNAITKNSKESEPLCVKVYIYNDKSYDIVVNEPTLTCLVKQMLNLERCATEPGRLQVGALARADIAVLAARKIKDMNASNIGASMRCVIGSLKSMGISIEH
ncbi:50S ribosomal protein L11 [Candidatus Hodgkinia cicadicola]